VGILEWLDKRNAKWASAKVLSERTRKPDSSYPVATSSHGLFAVTVVDLESERSPWRDLGLLPDPVALIVGLFAMVGVGLSHLGRRDRSARAKPIRFEARVLSLGFPAERTVCATGFVTIKEARSMQQRYIDALRRDWNPATPLARVDTSGE
jgi:hypothetical protein